MKGFSNTQRIFLLILSAKGRWTFPNFSLVASLVAILINTSYFPMLPYSTKSFNIVFVRSFIFLFQFTKVSLTSQRLSVVTQPKNTHFVSVIVKSVKSNSAMSSAKQ